jgi:hypothetical protein
MNRNIHIFYSHHQVSGSEGLRKSRPNWFDYEKCFTNLLKSISGCHNIRLNVIMDGNIKDNWIYKYQDMYNWHEIIGGNMNTVTQKSYQIIKDYICDTNDIIYILENDYLHINNWHNKVQTLYRELQNITYVSLYDHMDKYTHPMYANLVSRIWTTSDHHWRSTPSTCGSYLTTKEIFLSDYDDHTGVTVPIGDHHKWLYLNNKKQRLVITPVPGLSTHCMNNLMSPTIMWDQEQNI